MCCLREQVEYSLREHYHFIRVCPRLELYYNCLHSASFSDKAGTESSSVKDETIQLETSGYYYNDLWRPLSGITLRQFNDSSAITQCLRNKVINMYGDSTARQWFEYLIAFAPGKVHLHLLSLQPMQYNCLCVWLLLKVLSWMLQ